MTKPNHRPTVLPDSAVVETHVPGEVAEAIKTLADLSGVSRAAFVRSLILAGLEPYRVVSPETAAALPTTTYNQKEN
ncbi:MULTISPECIES: CopG family transcriptional regulator [unclassified Microbacterium]|uniref:ribbon-helix-helix domain-containing protein n=1 Tax=unclassified Microbacterium TaxID=2609290 RepID=UPI00300F809A